MPAGLSKLFYLQRGDANNGGWDSLSNSSLNSLYNCLA